MDEHTKQLLNMFDLEDVSEEEQHAFLEDFGDVIMKAVIRKSWVDFDSDTREAFVVLLEESNNDPENVEKQNNVFMFLDEHVPNLSDYVKKEAEALLHAYRENRDTLLDSST